MNERLVHILVGLFMLGAIAALMFLAFRVSGLTSYSSGNSYEITADFDNIGNLKVRAPVTVAGVRIGQVISIDLDRDSYKAVVTLKVATEENNIPSDSTASIVTAGLLGANYVAVEPGFSNNFLKEGDQIADTHSALQLETMIGQLLFSMNKDSSEAK